MWSWNATYSELDDAETWITKSRTDFGKLNDEARAKHKTNDASRERWPGAVLLRILTQIQH